MTALLTGVDINGLISNDLPSRSGFSAQVMGQWKVNVQDIVYGAEDAISGRPSSNIPVDWEGDLRGSICASGGYLSWVSVRRGSRGGRIEPWRRRCASLPRLAQRSGVLLGSGQVGDKVASIGPIPS